MKRQLQYERGFTLVELIVVIIIILTIATIVIASMSQARESTREKQRVTDLANIEYALTLYSEKNRGYPNVPEGIVVGGSESSSLDDAIRDIYGSTFSDPAFEAGTYEYWYDSSFTCFEAGQTVIYARTMEQSKNANFDEVCTAATPDSTNGAGSNSYIVVLGPSIGG